MYCSILQSRFRNFKDSMKFYIDKSLFDLFEYAVYYKNSYDIEFYTLNENYKEIWSKLRIYEDYGYTKLRSMGWTDNYGCYCVDVHCPDLIDYLISWNYEHWHTVGKSVWIDMVRERGWNDYNEIEKGWEIYHNSVNNWFKYEFLRGL